MSNHCPANRVIRCSFRRMMIENGALAEGVKGGGGG